MSDLTWLSTITSELTKRIFQSETRRLRKREIELVKENAKLVGHIDGFLYKGTLYSDLDPSIKAKGVKGNLHTSLIPTMEFFLADAQAVAFDRSRVQQALTLILKDCRSSQDVRDALPNSLKDMIEQIKDLPRTREEAYTVKGNERAYRQYIKLRDKIEFYNAAKLLY